MPRLLPEVVGADRQTMASVHLQGTKIGPLKRRRRIALEVTSFFNELFRGNPLQRVALAEDANPIDGCCHGLRTK